MIEQDCMKTCVVVAREHGLAAADPRLQSGQSCVLAMARRSVGPVSRPHGVGQRQPEVHMQRQRGWVSSGRALEPSSLQWRAGSCGKADRAVARTETWTSETRDRGGRVAEVVAEAVTEGKYGSSSCTFEESRSGGENALEGTRK
jgi:hypothetical protein